MVKGLQGGDQNLPADVSQVIDLLERHCLAPDGSLVSKSAHYDLQLVHSLSLNISINCTAEFHFSFAAILLNFNWLT